MTILNIFFWFCRKKKEKSVSPIIITVALCRFERAQQLLPIGLPVHE